MLKRQYYTRILYRAWHDSRLVLWTWRRLHERTVLEWRAEDDGSSV